MPPKPIGDPHVLDRKPKGSAKYDAVRPVVDTGGNVLKLGEVLSHRPPKEDAFRRVKCTSLQRLVTEEQPEVRAIVLDVRSAEEYAQCHIATALSFPSTRLSRSVNPFIPEVFHNKNRPDVWLVVYDLDEKLAVPTARLMYERGVDNVVVLTGGLYRWLEEGLGDLEGLPPAPPTPKPRPSPSTPGAATPRTTTSAASKGSARNRPTSAGTRGLGPEPPDPKERWK